MILAGPFSPKRMADALVASENVGEGGPPEDSVLRRGGGGGGALVAIARERRERCLMGICRYREKGSAAGHWRKTKRRVESRARLTGGGAVRALITALPRFAFSGNVPAGRRRPPAIRSLECTHPSYSVIDTH